MIHRDILDIEEELLKEWNEDKANLYIKRIDLFIDEIGVIIKNYKEFERTKQFFDTVEGDIKKLQSLTAKKSPKEYLAPSVVSAVMRVFISNLVAAATISNPLDNPYFWDLTWRTMISVYFVNFIDYYFNVFTILTNKTTKLMRLTK